MGVAAARAAARPDRLPAPRVPRADGAARAAGRRRRRPALNAAARRRGGRADGARLRCHDRAVGCDRLERPRPLRSRLDGRRQGALHRHLPPRRRAARPHEAAPLPPLPRHRPSAGAAPPDPDEPAARRDREGVSAAAARRGARARRPREPRALGDRGAARGRADDGRQDRPHVARLRLAELHAGGRRRALPGARLRLRRARAVDRAPALGGAPVPRPAGRHQPDRRAAARGHAPQPARDAARDRARRREPDVRSPTGRASASAGDPSRRRTRSSPCSPRIKQV